MGSHMPIVSSHVPLQAFVSSVMSEDMAPARSVCFDLLAGYLRVWEFERTPPAPVTAQEAYLGGVERSDLVIWLVGNRTPQAVRDEIELALQQEKPGLVFLFPSDARDAASHALIELARHRWKTANVSDLDDFAESLELALSDVLADAFRNRRQLPARALHLESLYRRLGGRAVAQWQALGVTIAKAQELLADSSVGTLVELLPDESDRVVVLVGDVGSGKTLAAIRFLRASLEAGGDHSPLPVWLDATSEFTTVESAIAQETRGLGDYRTDGVTLVLDGIDERTDRPLNSVLTECRAVANGFPHTTVLITSRPIPNLRDVPEVREHPPLSLDESAELMNRAFGLQVSAWDLSGYPAPVREAISRPLFSLLLGRTRTRRADVSGATTANLIADLVTGAVGHTGAPPTVREALSRMARRSIDSDGRPVAKSDIGTSDLIAILIRTRLVVETGAGDGLAFAVPVLRDWFGAGAIESGIADIQHVASNELQVERWRFAIFVALATMPRENVDDLLDVLARRFPAVASEAIEDAQANWSGQYGTLALPDAIELGSHYRRAIAAFLHGLEPASKALRPSHVPTLPILGVRLVGNHFVAMWREGELATNDPVVALPSDVQPPDWSVPGWSWTEISAAHSSPVWPWARARSELRHQLRQLIEDWGFVMTESPMRPELQWRAAVALAKRGDHDYRPIPITDLTRLLAGRTSRDVLRTRRGLIPIAPLLELVQKGTPFVECPYPDRDEEMTGMVWSGFSQTALLARTRAVYTTALAIYSELVTGFFPNFARRLEIAALMPLRLVGRLAPPKGGSWPSLYYRLEPLPPSMRNEIDIELAPMLPDRFPGLDDLGRHIRELRPESPWLQASAHTTILEVFGGAPATRLAFDWLAKDLHRHHWLDRLPSRF